MTVPDHCPAPSAPHASRVPLEQRTVIILDWDDTLLCSSVLCSRGIRLDSDLSGESGLLTELDMLSATVIEVLDIALACGEVHIVTNGDEGWVEQSCDKFFPRVVPYLDQLQITSARSSFEHLFPESPMKWKFHAFQDILSVKMQLLHEQDPLCTKNIMSFGDSESEREAMLSLTRGLPMTHTKCVKFACRPTSESLGQQLQLLVSCFKQLLHHSGNLDLSMALASNNTPAADSTPTPAKPAPVAVGDEADKENLQPLGRPNQPSAVPAMSIDTEVANKPHNHTPNHTPKSYKKSTSRARKKKREHRSIVTTPISAQPHARKIAA